LKRNTLLSLPRIAAGLVFFSVTFAHAGLKPIGAFFYPGASAYSSSTFTAPTGPESIAHSHNDFAQDHPLDTALEEKMTSIEVDVTDRRNEVAVVHLGFWTYGTIKTMYLDRLQRLVDEKGSVYGDGKKVTLWIEIRPFITGAAIIPLLTKLLDQYSMFAVYGKNGKIVHPGAVEAVIINDQARDYFANRETAPACLGTNGVDLSDEPNEPFECWNYMRWSRSFSWNGEGEIPETDLKELTLLQGVAHSRGLKTRYWGAPDMPEFWAQVRSLPFDLINTDNLHSTMQALRNGPERILASDIHRTKHRPN
jgi:hypothetical protein